MIPHSFTAQMVELVDTPDLGSGAARCVGSSPILGNTPEKFPEMGVSSAFFISLNLRFAFSQGLPIYDS